MNDAEYFLELARGYQAAAIFTAAAELDLFEALASGPAEAAALSHHLRCDPRGLRVLLDALVALKVLVRRNAHYALPPGSGEFLTAQGGQSILAMAQHQANCLRRWSQLTAVVRSGRPAARAPSPRGAQKDLEAFITAMDNVSGPVAEEVISALRPLEFRQLLDVGGASGTWTMAFLRACPDARATLLDLPAVIPLARARLERAGLAGRVGFAAGDFMTDPLPAGSDLAWISAIVHQNSREQNRTLFGKVHGALKAGGRIAIRDLLMAPDRGAPVAGALFAVNMLVSTEGGGTFTFEELREDLTAAGFQHPLVARQAEDMSSIVVAEKPA